MGRCQATAPMKRPARKSRAELIADQRDWIESHGGSLAGYVERYGSADDPKHFGDGGELIYAADIAALRRLEGRR
jgi:hypothetical protein